MTILNTNANLSNHDDVYSDIVSMFENLSERESLKVMAKFALLLANHIGDPEVVSEAALVASGTETLISGGTLK